MEQSTKLFIALSVFGVIAIAGITVGVVFYVKNSASSDSASNSSVSDSTTFLSTFPSIPATTIAPTTIAPTTIAPTTIAPTTIAPTTIAPTTIAPTTIAPTTIAPATTLPLRPGTTLCGALITASFPEGNDYQQTYEQWGQPNYCDDTSIKGDFVLPDGYIITACGQGGFYGEEASNQNYCNMPIEVTAPTTDACICSLDFGLGIFLCNAGTDIVRNRNAYWPYFLTCGPTPLATAYGNQANVDGAADCAEFGSEVPTGTMCTSVVDINGNGLTNIYAILTPP